MLKERKLSNKYQFSFENRISLESRSPAVYYNNTIYRYFYIYIYMNNFIC